MADWDELVLDLRAAGARMLTYINPYLSNDVTAKKPNHRRDLWAEANASGFLVRNQAGLPYIQVCQMDRSQSVRSTDLPCRRCSKNASVLVDVGPTA